MIERRAITGCCLITYILLSVSCQINSTPTLPHTSTEGGVESPAPSGTVETIIETPSQNITPSPTLITSPIPSLELPDLAAVLGAENPPPFDCPPILTLYLFDFDNTQPYRVIEEDLTIYNMNWSPDGRNLALSATSHDRSEIDLYIIDIESDTIQRLEPVLTGGANEIQPSWSPDGTEIAFVQSGGVKPYIHIMEIDGTDVRFIEEGIAPSWSPDGRQIVFIKPETNSALGELSVISIDKKVIRSVTKNVIASNPQWSPDGTKFLFYGIDLSTNNKGYYIVDIDGLNLIFLSPGTGKPSWLPNTNQIVIPTTPSSSNCTNS